MRTVRGRTDRVVVIGAGLAGLSAALHLAGRGREVVVLERAAVPGGRAGRLDVDGYRLDTGPTVLTMPDILEQTFAAVGDTLGDRLDLRPLHPAYDARFADGTRLAVHSEPDAMYAEVRRFAGAAEADRYVRLRDWLGRLYRAQYERFIAANLDSPLSAVTPALARVVALGGFRSVETKIAQMLRDERLRRVFSFQSLYAGVAPQRALAVYAVIAYMDTVAGVYFPRGGVRALPDALAAAAVDAGVDLRYDAAVTALERSGARVTAVRTAAGERLPCDAVVATTEPHLTYRLLGTAPRRVVPLRAAPSAAIVHVGLPAGADIGHHTIGFGAAWRRTFDELITEGRTMSDPSLLITRPTATDPGLAPPGRDLVSVLAPVPNLAVHRDGSVLDWDADGERYLREVLAVAAARVHPGLADAQILATITPADWARADMFAGTPFSYAHTLTQTGPFRPGNFPRAFDNVVLAGSGTTPGVGVPTALISGQLAADRITGVVRGTARVRATGARHDAA
ncbi:phytoene desaturase [Nocardia farcinica]|uniref:phytoene desaturase family protein n=1 Tax=Nocardia farcinica TaxID=37329 RepID=UPI000A3C22F6|nr:phytoene desaturase family protein [Nocardia farcinica]MBA4854741.1 phytoene desaturase [Nocardia farcinica]MBC9815096.1 phytoene desaturase [Nocardia farcinica]MBF6421482.1 phytoene desaturase [Nocardia farcinica]MBF6433139.1 phytoene desaturase [Nocardia farcinica]MBF6503957.1 phytoene desaturase [Nocardia farcinica]